MLCCAVLCCAVLCCGGGGVAEYAKSVPALLDSYMRHKQYLHTVCVLKHARELLFSEELGELEGLIDTRDELNTRKNAMQVLPPSSPLSPAHLIASHRIAHHMSRTFCWKS